MLNKEFNSSNRQVINCSKLMIINEVLYFGDYSIMITLAIFQMENISKVEPQYLEHQYLKYHGYVYKRNLVLPTTILTIFYMNLHISNPFNIEVLSYFYLCQ